MEYIVEVMHTHRTADASRPPNFCDIRADDLIDYLRYKYGTGETLPERIELECRRTRTCQTCTEDALRRAEETLRAKREAEALAEARECARQERERELVRERNNRAAEAEKERNARLDAAFAEVKRVNEAKAAAEAKAAEETKAAEAHAAINAACLEMHRYNGEHPRVKAARIREEERSAATAAEAARIIKEAEQRTIAREQQNIKDAALGALVPSGTLRSEDTPAILAQRREKKRLRHFINIKKKWRHVLSRALRDIRQLGEGYECAYIYTDTTNPYHPYQWAVEVPSLVCVA
jgi:hypothetical protein